jgi:hypothetical protein
MTGLDTAKGAEMTVCRGVRWPGECQLPAEVLLVARLRFADDSKENDSLVEGKLPGLVSELRAWSVELDVPGRVGSERGGGGARGGNIFADTFAFTASRLRRENIPRSCS